MERNGYARHDGMGMISSDTLAIPQPLEGAEPMGAGIDGDAMIDLYSFQHWDTIRRAFGRRGAYTPSLAKSREEAYREDADAGVETPSWNVYGPAYRWMMGEMTEAGLRRPYAGASPFWAWARWLDPDMQGSDDPSCLYEGFEDMYRGFQLLHLRVKASRVLCTSFDQYHCVLNNMPCGPIALLADHDGGSLDRWLEDHWEDSDEQKRRQWHDNVIVPADRMPDDWVQACLWTITPDDVLDITELVDDKLTITTL